MFYDMCGVEMTSSKAQHTQKICAIKLLDNDAAFEDIGGKKVWHPVWEQQVDHCVNIEFLMLVVECILDNKKVSRSVSMKLHTHLLSCRSSMMPTKGRERVN